MKIQLIDDEPYILKAMQRELRQYGDWETHTFTSVDDALKGLAEHDYDIVIGDYSMPHRNGIEYLQLVRERQPRATRILLTARADKAVLADAINKAQVHYFWEKPWHIEQLLAVIEHHGQSATE